MPEMRDRALGRWRVNAANTFVEQSPLEITKIGEIDRLNLGGYVSVRERPAPA